MPDVPLAIVQVVSAVHFEITGGSKPYTYLSMAFQTLIGSSLLLQKGKPV